MKCLPILLLAGAIAVGSMTAGDAAQHFQRKPPLMLAPPSAPPKAKRQVPHSASKPPAWMATLHRCNAYMNAQLLCARAVDHTRNAEKHFLACLDQEGFRDEPPECRSLR